VTIRVAAFRRCSTRGTVLVTVTPARGGGRPTTRGCGGTRCRRPRSASSSFGRSKCRRNASPGRDQPHRRGRFHIGGRWRSESRDTARKRPPWSASGRGGRVGDGYLDGAPRTATRVAATLRDRSARTQTPRSRAYGDSADGNGAERQRAVLQDAAGRPCSATADRTSGVRPLRL